LDSLKGADLAKKCERLAALHPQSNTDAGLRARALRAADGNPRLLEWLDKVLEAGGVDTDALLAAMEQAETRFRENVLTKALLEQLDEAARELLARLLVYELPVPKEAVAAVCEDEVALDETLRRTVALGLLERIEMDGEPHYRVPRLLAEVLPERITEELAGRAAMVLYRVWWKEAEESQEEQWLEIIRLGLIGSEHDIATEMTSYVSASWLDENRYRDSVKLCSEVLEVADDFRVRGNRGLAFMVLGSMDAAMKDCQAAFTACPISDLISSTSIRLNIARSNAIQGRLDIALQQYQELLEFNESLKDHTITASVLLGIARIHAGQGRLNEALGLYQDALKRQEILGDIKGKAVTLHEIGEIHVQRFLC